MQFVGDAVMAVFVRRCRVTTMPTERSSRRRACTLSRPRSIRAGRLKISPSSDWHRRLVRSGRGGPTGFRERLEYTLVGDTVNLTQRLQQLASAGETVISEPTKSALTLRSIRSRSMLNSSKVATRPRGVQNPGTGSRNRTSLSKAQEERPHDHRPK